MPFAAATAALLAQTAALLEAALAKAPDETTAEQIRSLLDETRNPEAAFETDEAALEAIAEAAGALDEAGETEAAEAIRAAF